MNDKLQSFAASFVESTRDYIYIRPEDNLLILRLNRIHYLNKTGTAYLHELYNQDPIDVAGLVTKLATRFKVPETQVEQDLDRLLHSISLILQGRSGEAEAVRTTPFGSHRPKFPVLSETFIVGQHMVWFCQSCFIWCGYFIPDLTREIADLIGSLELRYCSVLCC